MVPQAFEATEYGKLIAIKRQGAMHNQGWALREMLLHQFVLTNTSAFLAYEFNVIELAFEKQVNFAFRIGILTRRTTLILNNALFDAGLASQFVTGSTRNRALNETHANVTSKDLVH